VRRSNVERTAEQLRILNESGTALRGFVLQGHLFFGTASTVLDDIRRVLGEARFIVVDLWLVRGLDSSSAMAFSKVRRLAIDRQAQLVMTGVSPLLTARLKRAGFDLAAEPVRVFPDLDRGLEWCENRLIARAGLHAQAPGAVGLSNVDLGSPALRRYLQPVKLAAGEKVIRQGEASDALYIVGQGLVSVYLHGDTGPHGDAYIWRLRSFGPGTVVGEMGFYTHEPRSADVIADIESTLYRLSRESLAAMEREEPAAAQHFHRQVVATLALRLQAANNQLRLLL
jgi:SulP family sulfate permease